MRGRGVPGRRARAGVALLSAVAALVALGGVAAAATVPAAAGTMVHADEVPFSFD